MALFYEKVRSPLVFRYFHSKFFFTGFLSLKLSVFISNELAINIISLIWLVTVGLEFFSFSSKKTQSSTVLRLDIHAHVSFRVTNSYFCLDSRSYVLWSNILRHLPRQGKTYLLLRYDPRRTFLVIQVATYYLLFFRHRSMSDI